MQCGYNDYIYGGTCECDAVRCDENYYIIIDESGIIYFGDYGTMYNGGYFSVHSDPLSASVQCASISGGNCKRIRCSGADDIYEERNIDFDD